MSYCVSCGAEIEWVKTKSGKSMPLDAKPIKYIAGGKDVIVTKDGEVISGVRITEYGTETGYVSHFVTCPNANRHRKR